LSSASGAYRNELVETKGVGKPAPFVVKLALVSFTARRARAAAIQAFIELFAQRSGW
jgi:hypothetical protein